MRTFFSTFFPSFFFSFSLPRQNKWLKEMNMDSKIGCINLGYSTLILSENMYMHPHIHQHKYIYMCVCVSMNLWLKMNRLCSNIQPSFRQQWKYNGEIMRGDSWRLKWAREVFTFLEWPRCSLASCSVAWCSPIYWALPPRIWNPNQNRHWVTVATDKWSHQNAELYPPQHGCPAVAIIAVMMVLACINFGVFLSKLITSRYALTTRTVITKAEWQIDNIYWLQIGIERSIRHLLPEIDKEEQDSFTWVNAFVSSFKSSLYQRRHSF